MAKAIDSVEEIRCCMKTQSPLAVISTTYDFCLEQCRSGFVFSESQLLSNPYLSPWPYQHLPFVVAELSRQQNFHSTFEEFARGRIARAQGLGSLAGAMAKKAGRKDATVVEHEN